VRGTLLRGIRARAREILYGRASACCCCRDTVSVHRNQDPKGVGEKDEQSYDDKKLSYAISCASKFCIFYARASGASYTLEH
jgi:alkylhydroperoxidase family enzyme